MTMITKFLFVIIMQCLLVIALVFLVLCVYNFLYWKKKNIPTIITPTLLFELLHQLPNTLSKKNLGHLVKYFYDKGKSSGYKYFGINLAVPLYSPRDLTYIKSVLQTNFDHFTDKGWYYNEKGDILSANLFAIGGQKWRNLRTKLSPTFTSSKLKLMFYELLKCCMQLQEEIEQQCKSKRTIDIKTIFECFTIDVIGSCAFGLECNSLKNPEGEFRCQGKRIFDFPLLRFLRLGAIFTFQKLARRLNLSIFDQESRDFFLNIVKQTISYRKQRNITRNDFIQMLIDMRQDQLENNLETCTEEQIAAQVFIFFAAGYETSSLTLTFCLFELCKNLNIQNRVRDEINLVLTRHNGNITYEALTDMKYLQQVIDETLRKYPPVTILTRECTKDYKIPETKSIISKGTLVAISVLGIHHDDEYYPNPELFDPDRFSEKNNQQRVPYTYIPFGEGPRICIGLRFGLMQIKMGLVVLLRKYSFTLNNNTKIPLTYEFASFALKPKKILLDVTEC